MKDPHQYKRRTYDEAYELARKAFREQVTSNLSEAEITEMAMEGDISGGSICNDWEKGRWFCPEKKLVLPVYDFPSDRRVPVR
jgi:hypothetical protein